MQPRGWAYLLVIQVISRDLRPAPGCRDATTEPCPCSSPARSAQCRDPAQTATPHDHPRSALQPASPAAPPTAPRLRLTTYVEIRVRTTRWPRASSAWTRPRSSTTWGPWETPAQVEAATSEWAGWYNTRRVMRRTAGRPPAEYEKAWRDGTLGQVPARGPGSRPRRQDEGGGHGRRSLSWRAPPAPAGAPPRTPALLRDRPAGHGWCGSGRASPRRP